MLTELFIQDLIIVSRLELDLGAGMTVLTGETGAGKSILIDALGLALGDKAVGDSVRSGRERAEVIAGFDLEDVPAARDWLTRHSLEDGQRCLLRRVVAREGRSRAYINGRPTPLQQLRELGGLLLDIHGQHAHQSLSRPGEQRRLLDAYAGATALADTTAAHFKAFAGAREHLRRLRDAAGERASRLDLLRFQREELEALAPSPEELERIDEEQRRLRNLDRLLETGGALLQGLYEADQALVRRLDAALADLDGLLEYDSGLQEPRELLEGARIQVEEAAPSLRRFVEGLEPDPERLREVEQRLSEIYDLARKYRVEPHELPERLEAIRDELGALEGADASLERLEAELDALRRTWLEAARTLSARREEAARRLSRDVSEAMGGLGMADGRFVVHLTPVDSEQAGAHGLETVEFRVAANPGQSPAPLARVASGGELSRIALALQVATSRYTRVPTLIFDEVDTGIGGGVAEIVGRLLRRLGEERQVLCVTHLPQVAAQGHRHLRVTKAPRGDETLTTIAALDPRQRVEEIARMLGGMEITETTLAHAREMLSAT